MKKPEPISTDIEENLLYEFEIDENLSYKIYNPNGHLVFEKCLMYKGNYNSTMLFFRSDTARSFIEVFEDIYNCNGLKVDGKYTEAVAYLPYKTNRKVHFSYSDNVLVINYIQFTQYTETNYDYMEIPKSDIDIIYKELKKIYLKTGLDHLYSE